MAVGSNVSLSAVRQARPGLFEVGRSIDTERHRVNDGRVDSHARRERPQLLEPFAPWDGEDFERIPLLLKAKGKCTTDHISPAGPWLRTILMDFSVAFLGASRWWFTRMKCSRTMNRPESGISR